MLFGDEKSQEESRGFVDTFVGRRTDASPSEVPVVINTRASGDPHALPGSISVNGGAIYTPL